MKLIRNFILGIGVAMLVLYGWIWSIESQKDANELAVNWKSNQQGIWYATIFTGKDDNRRELFVVKIDPRFNEFKVFENIDKNLAKSLQKIKEEQHAAVVFNGAFFDEEFKAMGLLQDVRGVQHKKIKSDLMNGVFYVPNKDSIAPPRLFGLNEVPAQQNGFMIQNGPILIDDSGKIVLNADTAKLAARTAIGVDADGDVIVIVLHQTILNTDNALSLYQFAHLLKDDPAFAQLKLRSVLNLDGGPSSGIAVDDVYLPELSVVQNAILVMPRT